MASLETLRSQEVRGLCIAYEALGNLVNHALLDFTPVARRPGEMEVRFQSTAHRHLFHIRLLDFVHERGDAALLGGDALSCLGALERTGNHPLLSSAPLGAALASAAGEVRAWLGHPIHPKLWLSSIDVEVRLTVTRLELLKIAGNQAKHNAARLTGVSLQMRKLLAAHGHTVPLERMPFVLNDLREQLGENLFIYYGSWVSELLNNLTWAVHSYLQPVYQERIVRMDADEPGMYRFEPLPGVDPSSTEHEWLVQLLNHVRSRPYVAPFRASSNLREQSSLEWEDDFEAP